MDYAYFCTSLRRKSKDKLEKTLLKGIQQHPGTIKHPQLFWKTEWGYNFVNFEKSKNQMLLVGSLSRSIYYAALI